jgi:hypothetical protein
MGMMGGGYVRGWERGGNYLCGYVCRTKPNIGLSVLVYVTFIRRSCVLNL